MTDEQALAYLIEGAPIGKLATEAADGNRIHVVPIWFLVEVRGAATVDDAAPDLLDWATRISARDMGAGGAAPTAGATASPAGCWCAFGSTASAAGPAWRTEERA
jgi:hypothetical protein